MIAIMSNEQNVLYVKERRHVQFIVFDILHKIVQLKILFFIEILSN